MNISIRFLTRSALLTLPLVLGSVPAHALNVYLRVEQFNKTIPGSTTPVPMWGYRQCGQGSATEVGNCTGPVMSPGPVIRLAPDDNELNIYLANCLPEGLQNVTNSTSIVIPGLRKSTAPVFFTDSEGRQRIRSFDVEVPRSPNAENECQNQVPTIYSWTDVPAGTYMYQSGTHVQVQVQMGLYGAVVKNFAGGQALSTDGESTISVPWGIAYDPTESAIDPSFEDSRTLVFSEVDPALHQAVADDDYANPGCTAAFCPTSTEAYAPRFFLVNGEPYTPGSLPAIRTGASRLLLRLVNAGIDNHAPEIIGAYFDLLAEDAHPARLAHSQYNTLLAAAKTQDLILTSTSNTTYPLFDRRLRLINDTTGTGGMFLQVYMGGIMTVDDVFPLLNPNPNGNKGDVTDNDVDPNAAANNLQVTWYGNIDNFPAGIGLANLNVASSGVVNISDVSTANANAISASWVGDATFLYTVRENLPSVPTANELTGGPATVHLIRDMVATSTQYDSTSGQWNLAGRLRGTGLTDTPTVSITYTGNTSGGNACSLLGQPVGTGADAVPVTIDPDGNGSWTFTAPRAAFTGNCNGILITSQMKNAADPSVTYDATLQSSYTTL